MGKCKAPALGYWMFMGGKWFLTTSIHPAVLGKDLTYQDSCYWKVYLTPSEGHGIGWSKPSFWWIWCDSRGHLVLRSTSITKIYASSNPPCANLCFSFTFVRVNTANGPKSMAELNLGWFIRLLCLFLFVSIEGKQNEIFIIKQRTKFKLKHGKN